MFDWPFEFLPLVIAAVALVVARNAFNRTDELRRRLDAMEAIASAAAARPVAAPPPLPPQAESQQALVAEPAGPARPTAPSAFDLDAVRAESAPPPLPPPAPPPADPGL